MTTFDTREQAFENKYAYDAEIAFKINAKRNKLLGMWAAKKMGKTDNDALAYAQDVVMAEFESSGTSDVKQKLIKDFSRAGIEVAAREINIQMEQMLTLARENIMGKLN